MWPYPVRELETYTSLAVRRAVHKRVRGGNDAFWAGPQAHAWKEEEDQAWAALNRVAGDSLTRDDGALTSLVWAAAWHVTNHKYCCGTWKGTWNKFKAKAAAFSKALAAPDLSHDMKWLVWNCAWVEVHKCGPPAPAPRWNEGHHAGHGLAWAGVAAGALAAPFTFGLSLAVVPACSAGLNALPGREAIRTRDTDYEGALMRMKGHRENLRRREARLARVYGRADAEGVAQLRLLVFAKVQSVRLADEILGFLWMA